MDLEAIRKTYRRYAPRYDLYFGPMFQPGRRAVVQRMHCRPGDRILEVGVGTGLSLPLYPPGVRVVGIDISPEMLASARRRTARMQLGQVADLRVMDAESMEFDDDSFDKVVAMYVVSVAPQPARLVSEMHRVCKPGGELFIVNHFHSPNPIIGRVENWLAPLARLLGFHPDIRLDAFVREAGLEVIDTQSVNLFGYWKMLRALNTKDGHSATGLQAAG
ncbi:MAG TPA: methyltransferase domain-containing protein [Acidiferrobacterales bacterium]